MAQADVTVGVDYAVLGEDAVGGDEVVEKLRIHWPRSVAQEQRLRQAGHG
jgi:hypothetical protein